MLPSETSRTPMSQPTIEFGSVPGSATVALHTSARSERGKVCAWTYTTSLPEAVRCAHMVLRMLSLSWLRLSIPPLRNGVDDVPGRR